MRRFPGRLLAVCLAGTGAAAAATSWGGTYENTVLGFYRAGVRVCDENRIRLDIDVTGGTAALTGDVVLKRYFGAKSFDYTDFLPGRFRPLLLDPATGKPVQFRLADTFYLDNAALSLHGRRTNLTVGIQQLPWGAGYAWNPVDLWNHKDLFDPGYDKPGQAGLKLEQGLGPLSFTGAAGLDDRVEHAPWTVALQLIAGGWDLSAIAGGRVRHLTVPTVPDTEYYCRRNLLGGYASGQVFAAGVWCEGGWNRERPGAEFGRAHRGYVDAILSDTMFAGVDSGMLATRYGRSRDYVQAVVGADYTAAVGNGLYMMVEYLYNGDGRGDSRAYSLEDWTGYAAGTSVGLGIHSVFAGIGYAPTDLSNLQLFVIGNLSDASLALNPRFSYSVSDDCDWTLMAAVPFGDQDDEFGLNRYLVSVRLKLYW